MSNITDVTMGLPRLSGKRSWTEAGGGENNVPSKLLCTSPPHAICAEDVPQNSPPTTNQTADMAICKMDESEEKSILPTDSYAHLSESEDDNFIDDEEDKDSGFIDGNSIDNSSDDDDSKENTFTTSTAAFTSFGSHVNFTSESSTKSSVAERFNDSSTPADSSALSLSTVTTSSKSCIEPKMSISESFSTYTPTFTNTISLATNVGTTFADSKVLDTSTVTAANTLTGTVVTNTYQGSVSSSSYDLHPYPNIHPSDPYFHRPGTPAWSCNFYDGSHPNTNKYMEISPNRSLTSQSIQCDENGKSYIELGSASPYNNTYPNNECSDLPTSPSTYQSSTYTTSFSGTSNFGPSSAYYNSRQPYGQHFSYNQNEPYNYENDNPCSYSYSGSYGNGLLRGSNSILSRSLSRCTSPYCDPTKTSPRPACYNQQRLSVFNMSMFKLNRFSRFPEPNLHRSVLICNTLRHIEKEFETEGISMSAIITSHNQAYGAQAHPPSNEPSNQNNGIGHESLPSMSHSSSNEGPLPSMHSQIVGAPLQLAPFSPSTTNQSSSPPPLTSDYNSSPQLTCQTLPYSSLSESNLSLEHKEALPSLRPYNQSPITPPSSNIETVTESETSSWPVRSNVTSSEEKTEGINWCSVLSLSSQSDMDSVNNNECNDWSSGESIVLPYTPVTSEHSNSEKLPSLSADDVLKSFPETRRPDPTGEIDSLIKDMLGS